MSKSSKDREAASPDAAAAPEGPARAHLQAVRDADLEQAANAAPEGVQARRSRRGVLFLGLALGVSCVMLLGQLVQNWELEGQVEALASELSETSQALLAAEAAIQGYALRMAEVRGSVGDLMTRVGALQALVEGDPTGQTPPDAAAQH